MDISISDPRFVCLFRYTLLSSLALFFSLGLKTSLTSSYHSPPYRCPPPPSPALVDHVHICRAGSLHHGASPVPLHYGGRPVFNARSRAPDARQRTARRLRGH
eukprot:1389592-Pleurochrysis_carterae.AAC.1